MLADVTDEFGESPGFSPVLRLCGQLRYAVEGEDVCRKMNDSNGNGDGTGDDDEWS